MLSDQRLSEIVKGPVATAGITDAHWRTQESTETSVLFYKIGETPAAEAQFYERIASCAYGWIVVDRSVPKLPAKCSVADSGNWMLTQQLIMDELYPVPKNLRLLAVTGTNGKTTTADLVLQLGAQVGKRGMSIGTLGVRDSSGLLIDFGLTSPSFIDLRKFLHRYGGDKDFCVLEASSHALHQGRLQGLNFDGAGWLSFSQDHLDYHVTMEAYFQAKGLLLKKLKPDARVFVPVEQEELLRKLRNLSDRVTETAPVTGDLPLFFKSKFNRNNLEVAVSMVTAVLGAPKPWDFSQLLPPEGRFFIRPYGTNYIVVDFAHTPDALENICQGIRDAFPEHALKILFGCGGDRDRKKRPQMAEVAQRWADFIYLTSDNPRFEEPAAIIADIEAGLTTSQYKKIILRPDAVAQAVSELGTMEVLLLAGKGHEDYILIGDKKYPYSDIRQVEDLLAKGKA